MQEAPMLELLKSVLGQIAGNNKIEELVRSMKDEDRVSIMAYISRELGSDRYEFLVGISTLVVIECVERHLLSQERVATALENLLREY